MKLQKMIAAGIVLMLLISVFGTGMAQTTTPPTPAVTSGEEGESLAFTHPVVAMLSTYFGRQTSVTATGTPAPAGTPAPTTTNGEEVGGTIGEEIAAYHEAGMGFGVLVKFYAMAEAASLACAKPSAAGATPAAGTCTAVSVEELIDAFNSGTGMGQLFKEYGKPAMLGVGQVRKENAKLQLTPVPGSTAQPTLQSGTPQAKMNGKSQAKTLVKPTRVAKVKPNHK